MQTLTLFSDMLKMKGCNDIGAYELPRIQLICKSPAYTDRPRMTCSRDCHEMFMKYWEPFTMSYNERMLMIPLNRANEMLGVMEIGVGGVAGTVADPKMIFTAALLCGASGIVLAHNHPSGKLCPSQADIKLTKKIEESGKMLEIKLIDHMIMIPDSKKYYSFADEGMI